MRSLPISVLFALGAVLAALPVRAATEYHWVGAPIAEFGTPTNWNPVRTTPAPDDRLVFDGGGDYTVMNPTTSTIGQFIVESPTRLILSSTATFGGRLTIAGGPGTDFEMEPGTSIRITGNKPISFVVGNGATASISGWYTIDSNPAFHIFHQLIGEAPEAIQFMAGSIFELREGMFSNPFSRSLNPPPIPGMVRFRQGSTYVHGCALPPPITDVVFDPDSRYRHVDETAPSFVGRTFGDFEYDSPLTQVITGNGNFTVGDLMVTQGRLNLAVVGEGIVTDHIIAQPGAYLRLGATSGTLNLRLVGGTAGQQILQNPNNGAGGAGLTTTSGLRLIVDNPWGARFDFGVPLDFAGVLEFRRGIVSAPFGGANVVRLRYGGTTTGASPSTGWIHGAVRKDLPPGQPSEIIPVGTATEYTPITLVFQDVLADTTVVSAVVQSPGDPPAQPLADSSFAGAQIDTTKKVNLQWALSFVSNHVLPTTVSPPMFGVELGFQAANLDPGADWTNFVSRLRTIGTEADTNKSWRGPAGIVVRGSDRLIRLGVQGDHPSDYFFKFAVGEPSVVSVTVQDPAVEEGGAALRTGPAPEGSATSLAFRVSLSEPAVGTITVDYATAAGSAEEGTDFTAVDGTLTFQPGDTVKIVDVPILGEGVAENHETLSLVLSNATGAVIADGEGQGTILDDDDVTPPAATVVYPNGGEALIEGATVDLLWTATDNVTVEAMKLFYSTDGGTNWLPIATDVPNTGSYSWQVPTGLTQNALFRVRAYDHHGRMGVDESDAPWWIWNVEGVEPPAAPRTFTFAIASANPSSGRSRFRLSLTRDQSVRVGVFDAAGRLVALPLDGTRPAGLHEVSWDGAGAAAGIYFVRVDAEEGMLTRRIVRVR